MSGRLRKNFKLAKSFTPLYTGGAIGLSSDGSKLYSTLNEDVVLTDTQSGERLHLFSGDRSTVTTLAVSPENASSAGVLLVAYQSLALRFYAAHDYSLSRSFARAHEAPITIAISDPTGSLFATGSADGIVKIWDATYGHCTHVFRGHGGVMSALCFDISPSREPRLFSASDDCRIRGWDLTTRKALFVLNGHSSVVRGLAVTSDGETLVSGGRDKIYNVWQLPTGTLKHAIPVFETLEAVGIVDIPVTAIVDSLSKESKKGKKKQVAPEMQRCVWTAGDAGKIRLWDLQTGQAVSTPLAPTSTGQFHEIVYVCALANILVTAHVDQNLLFHRLPSLMPLRHIVGYNDEVVDILYLTEDPSNRKETHLAVATNSDLIRLYNLGSFDTTLLAGHHDVVLCLARNQKGSLFLSGSKDRTARIWQVRIFEEGGYQPIWQCIGVCEGHLESVGAVAIAPKAGAYSVTASQDRTIKIWDMSAFGEMIHESNEPSKARSLATLKVHDKDINALDISPNDRLLATGSQDRTAKLFAVDFVPATKSAPLASAKLVPLGIFKGHKRGVWSVKFSPTEQCLATASGDKSIKLWNINDFTCIKTFEGHTNTVLRVDILPEGLQMASCASDGLVKIWNIKNEECVATMDNHEEKIWALTCNYDASTIISGGADSVISFWQDVTEIQEEEQAAAQEEQIMNQQDLANYMDVKDYRNAILLALSINQPRRLYSLLSEILSENSPLLSSKSSPVLGQVLSTLSPSDTFQLLEYVRDWNSKSRDAEVAQSVLYTLLRTQSSSKILKAHPAATGFAVDTPDTPKVGSTSSIGDIIEALIPYTERHYARADRLEQESAFLDFVVAQMDDYAIQNDNVMNGDSTIKHGTNGDGNLIDDMPAAGR